LPTASAIYSIGNRVFYDTNNNGIQDGSEVGIGGVTVDLLDSGNNQIATQTTSTTTNIGYYRFDSLVAGTYKVRIRGSNFTSGGVLYGYQNSSSAVTGTDQRDNGVDPASSNPSTAGVVTGNIVVGNGVIPVSEPDVVGAIGSSVAAHASIGDGRDNLTVDFGFYKLCLGDLLFVDANSNGTYGAGDSTLSGAIVKLYQANGTTEVAVGPDGILGTADDTTGATNQLTTGSNGLYQFCGLTPGSYVVKVTPPSGYKSTTDVAGTGSPDGNTDNDDNGIGVGTGQVSSAVNASAMALTPGSEPTVTNATGTTINNTMDFGFNAVTAVKFDKAVLNAYDKGTMIEWQTGYEANNLGFNIYRDEGGKRALVNQQMLAGSALQSGEGIVISAGMSYSWWDNTSPSKNAAYWLEAVDLSGTSEWFGPFYANQVSGAAPARSNSAPLNRLGATAEQVTRPVETLAAMPKAMLSLVGRNAIAMSRLSTLKIAIKEEGWYRLTQAEMQSVGFDASVDPQTLQLYVDSVEVPINVTVERDGTVVEFYGLGLDSPYTSARTYYLVAGNRAGLRIPQVKGIGKAETPTGFAYTVERRDRTIYFSSLRNGDKENFFGAVIARNPLDQTLNLPHVDAKATGEALLDVSVQGVTLVNHNILVQLNGASLGYMNFSGQALGSMQFRVSHEILKEGENKVTLTPLGGASDVDLVDTIRLTYQHQYAVDNDALKLSASGGQTVNVNGFSNKNIDVFDVTNPQKPCHVSFEVNDSKEGGYGATFAAPEGNQRKFFVFTSDKKKAPASFKAEEASSWRQPSNSADFIILTAKEFAPALEALKTLRQSQGLKVEIVFIEDIYDEFSCGHKTPQAIKDFLAFTQKWSKAPRYAMFVGDAVYDPKNYLGVGDYDFVPTKLVETSYMETASDEWLGDFNNDGLADICIGRLPVRTLNDATLVVGKIISYETSTPSQEMLLVADYPDIYDFEGVTDTLKTLATGQGQIQQLKRAHVDADTAKRQLLEALNRGQKLVNYVGHGSVDLWRGNLLTSADVATLRNEKLSLVVIMSCLNGYFQDVYLESLGESLLRVPQGGAVAVWASSGLTEPAQQALMNQELYRQLFVGTLKGGGKPAIGDAVKKAKAVIGDADIRQTWILFGDPTMKLK
jgi:hypothetical protein